VTESIGRESIVTATDEVLGVVVLGALGLSPAGERIYRAVVSGYRGDADTIAAGTGRATTRACSRRPCWRSQAS
jgi:hypothetical protein